MTTFGHDPSEIRQIAQYTIEQRVRDAEQRRLVRSARRARAEQRSQQPVVAPVTKPSTSHVPWSIFRRLHAAH
jgi:hypothetical protein